MEKKKILAVDDVAIYLQMLAETLSEFCDVRTAKDTDKAMRFLSGNDVDLILLDIDMPGMDGFEFLEVIRKFPSYKDIPVIFITSHSSGELVRKALDKGVRYFLTKPVKPAFLRQKVEAALQNDENKETVTKPAEKKIYEAGKYEF